MNKEKQVSLIHAALSPHLCRGTKTRIGPDRDSGYIVIEEALKEAQRCICLGAGSNIDVEKELASMGKPTVCYDQHPDLSILTELKDIEVGGFREIGKNLTYHRVHVNNQNIENVFGGEESFFLKMDIEGGEWEVMRCLTSTMKKRMIMLVVEYHLNNSYHDTGNLMTVYDVLRSITETHHLVHIHGNNYDIPCYGGTKVPAVVECCYISKDMNLSFDELDMVNKYPTSLDFPCNPNRLDYRLDWWK